MVDCVYFIRYLTFPQKAEYHGKGESFRRDSQIRGVHTYLHPPPKIHFFTGNKRNFTTCLVTSTFSANFPLLCKILSGSYRITVIKHVLYAFKKRRKHFSNRGLKVYPHQASTSAAAAALTVALTLGMGLGAIFQHQHQLFSLTISSEINVFISKRQRWL